MGQCYGKDAEKDEPEINFTYPSSNGKSSFPLKSVQELALPNSSPLPDFGISPARSTPRRFLRKPLFSPSPAKHIQAALLKRRGPAKPKEGTIPEGLEVEKPLDKNFGYSKNFSVKYDLGHEVGRGHFGHTCLAKGKKGDLKGQSVAVKIISKLKMTTMIAIEDVRREVKILKALSGHHNLVRFYDACEDTLNVYIVME
ncbi:hypothetical protein O6H91_Y093100 [Diphasiastrum complanatum]|nr:hypothetical protein O6H91_Y093100 [Diphasiastrum complanatum]